MRFIVMDSSRVILQILMKHKSFSKVSIVSVIQDSSYCLLIVSTVPYAFLDEQCYDNLNCFIDMHQELLPAPK